MEMIGPNTDLTMEGSETVELDRGLCNWLTFHDNTGGTQAHHQCSLNTCRTGEFESESARALLSRVHEYNWRPLAGPVLVTKEVHLLEGTKRRVVVIYELVKVVGGAS